MLPPLLQAVVSLLFLLFVFGVIEHVFGNKRGKLPRKRELLLDVLHAAFNQIVTRVEFLVPTEILKRGDNSITISVNRKGPFPPSKSVKVEKVELHLK